MSVVERFTHAEIEGLRVGRFSAKKNTTCILYRLGKCLIDSGPPNQWSFVKAFIRESRPVGIVLTHHHEDHAGNGAVIARELHLPVAAPSASIPLLSNGFPLQLYRRVVWGTPQTFVANAAPDVIELDGGFRLQQIAAPGHAPDMVCYLEPERGWLFSADLFITPQPKYLRIDEDPQVEITSLRTILTHDFTTVCCAHAGIIADGKRALQRKLDYLEALREKVRTLRQQGMSVAATTRQLLGKEETMHWITLGHFSKRNLVAAFAK